MSPRIEVLPRGSELEWDEFVFGQRDATLCHLAAWRTVVEKAYRLRSLFLLLREDQGIRGILPLVHLRGPLAPNRLVSMPFLDQGGALSDSEDASLLLIEAAAQLARRRGAKGLDLRAPRLGSPSLATTSRRFRFLLSLPASDDKLWKKIGPKVRNQIRKSEKGGLFSEVATASSLPEFYRVFSRNMRDLGSPTHSVGFFRHLAQQLGDRFRLYLTHDAEKRAVAGGVAIYFKGSVTVPWASSLRSARSHCPNHSLYWKILRDARQAGASSFDFGRSTEGTGTFHFKKQWGAEAIPLIWTFLDPLQNPQSDYYLDPRTHSAATQIWRHLPLSVTLKLGPLIRRQLPN